MDAEKGYKPQQDDDSIDVGTVIKYNLDDDDPNRVGDGEW
jgi:hypothetical protein